MYMQYCNMLTCLLVCDVLTESVRGMAIVTIEFACDVSCGWCTVKITILHCTSGFLHVHMLPTWQIKYSESTKVCTGNKMRSERWVIV